MAALQQISDLTAILEQPARRLERRQFRDQDHARLATLTVVQPQHIGVQATDILVLEVVQVV